MIVLKPQHFGLNVRIDSDTEVDSPSLLQNCLGVQLGLTRGFWFLPYKPKSTFVGAFWLLTEYLNIGQKPKSKGKST